MNQPTQLRPAPPRDRTAQLRALLQQPSDVDISADLLRAIGQVLVEMDKDLYRVPYVSNQVAQLTLTIQDFIEEYLHSRRTREEDELEEARTKYEEIRDSGDTDEVEFYKAKYEKAREKVHGTSQKLEAVQLGKQQVAQVQQAQQKATWIQLLGLDSLLKDIVKLAGVGLVYFIGRALWEYFKAQLH